MYPPTAHWREIKEAEGGQRDSTGDRILVLHVVDLGSIPDTKWSVVSEVS